MDDKGNLYFGFRAPQCADGGAVIFTANADAIFANAKQNNGIVKDASILERHCVGTGDMGDGIISMEFDAQTKNVLVVTGTPDQ